MLRGQAVVDGEHVRPGVAAEDPAHVVVSVQVAVEEAAAVVVDEQRMGAAGLERFVVAGGDRRRSVDHQVGRRAHGDRPSPEHRGETPSGLPGLGRRQGLERRLLAALEQWRA